MNNEIMLLGQQLPDELKNEIDEARELIKNARSKNTRKSYESDWKLFVEWCEKKGFPFLPSHPAVIVLYIKHLAEKEGRKISTIQRKLSSISQKHTEHKFNSPTKDDNVRLALKSLKRKYGTRPTQKQAATATIIKKICDQLPDNLKGLRDRAILQVGMAGAFRRSELVALNVEDIEFHEEGMTIFLPQSKTDQDGQGELIGIEFGDHPYCPVRTLQAWLKQSGIKSGAVFRRMDKKGEIHERITPHSIARIVKKAAEKAGFNGDDFAGHSLRRGLITTAKRHGIDEFDIMQHTRHRSIATMRRYIDKSDVFKNNPTKGLWK